MQTHQKIPADLAKRAAEMPEQYMNMANDSEEGGRDSALLLTKDDVIAIKRYEKTALSLPRDLKSTEAALGFAQSGVKGLEPVDILGVYTKLRTHGATWGSLEQEIKTVGTRLDLFSGNFIISGEKILEVVNAMDIIDQIVGNVGDLVRDDLKDIPGLPLSAKDQQIKGGLRSLLDRMKVLVAAERDEADRVKNATVQFARTMTVDLIPAVAGKLDIARRNGLAKKVEQLNADILELDKVIDQKKKEYDQLVGQALDGGKFMGPVGLIIMGGIFGAKAEKVRKEKNKLIKEREAKVAQVKTLVPLIEALANLESHFKNLEIRLLDAEEGANNLKDMWVLIFTYIDESHKKLAGINDSLSLLEFTVDFAQVIKPWYEIKGISRDLSVLFNTALKEWKEIHDKEPV